MWDWSTKLRAFTRIPHLPASLALCLKQFVLCSAGQWAWGKLLLLHNQSGCLKSVPLPQLHAAEEVGARGGQRLLYRIWKGQAEQWQEVKCRGTASAIHAGSRKNGQGPEKKGHLAYQLPGVGNMAKFSHHLLPVHKTTLEKSNAKCESLQCFAVQLHLANNSWVHPSEGITMPLVHNGFWSLFQMSEEMKVV